MWDTDNDPDTDDERALTAAGVKPLIDAKITSTELILLANRATAGTYIRQRIPTATAAQIAHILRAANFTASQIAVALVAAIPGITASQIAVALVAANFTASQIAVALVAAIPGITASQIAVALVAAIPGITASQIAVALVAANFTASQIAVALVAANFTASQIAVALVAAIPGITASQIAVALVAANFTASQIAVALVAAGLGWEGVSPDMSRGFPGGSNTFFTVQNLIPTPTLMNFVFAWSSTPSGSLTVRTFLNQSLPNDVPYISGNNAPNRNRIQDSPGGANSIGIQTENNRVDFTPDTSGSSIDIDVFIRWVAMW